MKATCWSCIATVSSKSCAANKDEDFGEVRLARIARQHGAAELPAIISRVMDELRAWAGDGGFADDVTLVLARRTELPAASPSVITATPARTGLNPDARAERTAEIATATVVGRVDSRRRSSRARDPAAAGRRTLLHIGSLFVILRGDRREVLRRLLVEVKRRFEPERQQHFRIDFRRPCHASPSRRSPKQPRPR